jgi:hypothetical protein
LAEKFLPYYFVPAFFWLIAALEWLSTLTNTPRHPWLYTIAAALLTGLGGVQIFRLRKRIAALQQGRDGERTVGHLLEGLRRSGAQVFHDVPGDGFNLDHVVVSEHGILVVETKTRSKPTPRSAITLQGDDVFVAGRKMDRNPIHQVRAQMAWQALLLKESTGRKMPVLGAVVFPGWFVERGRARARLDVWVLEPKALPSFIEHEPVRLTPEDVALAAFHLSRYVKAAQS